LCPPSRGHLGCACRRQARPVCWAAAARSPPFIITRQYLFAPYPLFTDSGEKTPLSGRYACFRNASRRASMSGRIAIRPYRRARPLSIAVIGLRFEVASEQSVHYYNRYARWVDIAVCKPFLGGLPGLQPPALRADPFWEGVFVRPGPILRRGSRRSGWGWGACAQKRGALFLNLKKKERRACFVSKHDSAVVSFYTGTDRGFPSREGGLCRPASISLGRTAANGATVAQMNFGMWCIQLARVGFPGRAHRLTGLGSTAGALSRLLIQQARRSGFRPYIRAG
jgi:hypothetical protein